MQRNNNARSKQNRRKLKRKLLLQSNRESAILARRLNNAKVEPKGRTIHGRAKEFAVDYHTLFPDGGGGWMFSPGFRKSLNQRQKRKRKKLAGSY